MMKLLFSTMRLSELRRCIRRASSDPRAHAATGLLLLSCLLAGMFLMRSAPHQAYAGERVEKARVSGKSIPARPDVSSAIDSGGADVMRGRVDLSAFDSLRQGRDPARSLVRLKGYLHGLEEENASLKEKNELLEKLAAAKDTELDGLHKDNTELQQNLNHLLETHVALKGQFQQNVEKLKVQLNDKNDELSNLNVMKYIRVTMQTQLNDLNAKLLELTNEKGSLEADLIKAKQEKGEVEQKLQLTESEVKRQAELNDALNSTIVGMKDELSKREGELKTFKTPDHDMELQLIKLKGEKEQYRLQLDELTKRLDAVDSSKGDSQKSVYELSALVTKKELEKQLEVREKDKAIAKLQEDYNRILRENESLKLQLESRSRTKR